jgi:hypothetical protein
MPLEWNTRSTVEVPELFVCGLLQASELPTLLGSAAFSRATLSKSSRLSSDERPRLPLPRNGLTWACADADRRKQAASAADKQRADHVCIHLPFPSSAYPPPPVRLHAKPAISASLGGHRRRYQIPTQTATAPHAQERLTILFWTDEARTARRTSLRTRDPRVLGCEPRPCSAAARRKQPFTRRITASSAS